MKEKCVVLVCAQLEPTRILPKIEELPLGAAQFCAAHCVRSTNGAHAKNGRKCSARFKRTEDRSEVSVASA